VEIILIVSKGQFVGNDSLKGLRDIEIGIPIVGTTIRQPLINMGRIVAQCVLNRLHGTERYREQIVVEPELMVRESTGLASTTPSTIRARENKKSAKPDDFRGD
jgi:hypothetical protein